MIFGIDTFFYKIFYWIMYGILGLVDTVYSIIKILCGMEKGTVNNASNSILEALMKDDVIKKIFTWVCILGVCVLGVVICIAVIRAVLSRKLDDPITAQKGIATRTISSIILMVLIPVFFFVFISLVGNVTEYILNSMNTGTDRSIAESIFNAAISNVEINPNHIPTFKWTPDEFNSYYPVDPGHVNYIIGIFGGATVLVAMAMLGFKLIERIFMLLFYFIVSPIILAISPLDDGNRFNIWRDSVIAKLLASAGIIICLNLYVISLPIVNGFAKSVFTNNFMRQVFMIIFVIAGAFFASRGSEIIANLVGDNIGANEGRETMDSLRKASAGIKLGAGAVASGLALGFGSKASRSRGFANSLGNKIKGGTSGIDDNSTKATKNGKFSKIWSGVKDTSQNFGRFGAIGGSIANGIHTGINIHNARASKKANEDKSNDDTKAKKE